MARFSRYLSPLVFFLGSVLAGGNSQQVQAGTLGLTDLPLFLVEGVAPNIVLTMDDSGSMQWGYLPDTPNYNDPEFTSNVINPMYYDPEIDYRPALHSDGAPVGNGQPVGSGTYRPEADFFNAVPMIFGVANGFTGGHYNTRVNLSNAYRVTQRRTLTTPYYRWWSNNGPAYYHTYDATRPGCANPFPAANMPNSCFTRVNVSATSGPSRVRPELGFVTSRDERTNFANWYQFYATRMHAAKTVMSIAFSPQNVSSNVRVGRHSLNRARNVRSGNPWNGMTSGDDYVRAFAGVQRDYFYRWIFNVNPSGGTPLLESMRRVGEFFRRSGQNSPYTVNPGGPSPENSEEISCRLNAHIMISDGTWNSGYSRPGGFIRDHNATTFPDGKAYSPGNRPIYGVEDNTNRDTLADFAFHYWAKDLRPDLENNVPPYMPSKTGNDDDDYWNPKNDPASWQHVINYNVAFGQSGFVPLTDTVYDQLLEGTAYTDVLGNTRTGWPSVGNGTAKIDDMYHAAVNSRGSYFSATKPEELVTALVSIMNSLSARESSASSLDANSGSISGGAAIYQAKFSTTDWTGDLLARPVSTGDGSNSCNSQPRGSICDEVWDAGEVNQRTPTSWNTAKVFTIDPSRPEGQRGKTFRWGQLTNEQRNMLHNGDNLGQHRLQYIRGNANREQSNGGTFRNRATSDLGAIVHSSPEYIGNGFDASGSLSLILDDEIEGAGKPKHRDFLCQNPQFDSQHRVTSCSSGIFNRQPVVYVGANDGMLHAFNADTSGANGGRRIAGFIPSAIVKELWRYTEPTFVSGAYVDGDLSSADVFYDNAWHTVLVGGLRTGGQSYYGLDVTDPSILNTESLNNGRKLALWEFGDRNTAAGISNGAFGATGDPDMGYSFGEAVIVKSNYTGTGDGFPSNNGRWVAIFGNGYNATEADGSFSSTGHAAVYVVDIETGKLIKKFNTRSGTFDNPNGIATTTAVYAHDKESQDYTADYIYAGDLRGNVWKMDISSSNRNDWKIAYGTAGNPQPLFTTSDADGNAQPITSKLRVAGHPANRGGLMVYFGTGKYLEEPDNHTTSVQSFYGVWDPDQCTTGGGTVDCGDASLKKRGKNHVLPSGINRGNLLQQSITLQGGGGAAGGSEYRETSDHAIQWRDGGSGHYGWYMDLVYGNDRQGERVVGRAALRGNLVVFASLVPTSDPCSTGAFGWLMALDRSNGGRPETQPFDINGDGEIGENDFSSNNNVTSGAKSEGVLSNPQILADVSNDKMAISSDGETKMVTLENGFKRGRHRWQQMQ